MANFQITQLQQQFDLVGNAQTKAWWEAYLKYSLPFHGLKLPQVRAIVHSWAKTIEFTSLPPEQQFDIAIASQELAGLYVGNPRRKTARPTAEIILAAFKEITLLLIEVKNVYAHVTALSPLQERNGEKTPRIS